MEIEQGVRDRAVRNTYLYIYTEYDTNNSFELWGKICHRTIAKRIIINYYILNYAFISYKIRESTN